MKPITAVADLGRATARGRTPWGGRRDGLLLASWALLLLAVALPSGAAERQPSGAPAPRAEFFDLRDVRLLDGPFRQAMELNAQYLLSLEADRLLSGVRRNAGLEPKAPRYGGWENQGVAGQSLGHYMTALAQQYRATGDQRFLQRSTYIVGELAECQAKDATGYVAAIPDGKAVFVGLKRRGGRMQGWVPWYTMHKLFQGLRDAWRFTGNEQAKAVLIRLADWADAVTKDLTEREKEVMLSMEHGGMNETLADVYAITHDPKHLAVARRFCHRLVMDPLARGEDRLDGLHANTQIPKITGAARLHELTGEDYFRQVAIHFWDCVVTNRSYVIGGNSDSEHFFPPATHAKHLTSATAETCNTYNLLKLTEHLFGWEGDVRRMDYYERALYNQILASQDPRTGMFTYFIPMKPGDFKHRQRYSVYFETYTPADWTRHQAVLRAEEERQKALAARAVDDVRPGEQQSEVDHAFQGEKSSSGGSAPKWRDARDGGWFEYQMRVPSGQPAELLVTYWGSDAGNRRFDILVEGQKVASEQLVGRLPNELFEQSYGVPTALTRGKSQVTVRFQAQPGNFAGGVFGLRLLRAEGPLQR